MVIINNELIIREEGNTLSKGAEPDYGLIWYICIEFFPFLGKRRANV